MALATASVINLSNALKIVFPQKRVDLLFYKDHPFAAMVKKKDDFYGGTNANNSMWISVQHGVPQGRSARFADAQANVSTGLKARFQIVRRSDYQLTRLENELIEASSKDMGALVNELKNAIDTSITNLGRNYAAMLFGNGVGARGAIGAIDGLGTTLTLANPDDIVKFEVDMRLDASIDETGVAGVKGDQVDILAVDRSAGTILVSADVTGLPAPWVVGDFLYQMGDYNAVITGLRGWIPEVAPAPAALFFGYDRSEDTDRLAGVRFNGLALPLEEALKSGVARVLRNGGRPETCIMNPLDFNALELSLESRLVYEDVPSRVGGVGFRALVINTAAGPLKIVADVDCPAGLAYALTMDTWTFHGLKAVPHMLMPDGNTTMTRDGFDEQEFRAVYRGNLACTAPGWNGVIQVAR